MADRLFRIFRRLSREPLRRGDPRRALDQFLIPGDKNCSRQVGACGVGGITRPQEPLQPVLDGCIGQIRCCRENLQLGPLPDFSHGFQSGPRIAPAPTKRTGNFDQREARYPRPDGDSRELSKEPHCLHMERVGFVQAGNPDTRVYGDHFPGPSRLRSRSRISLVQEPGVSSGTASARSSSSHCRLLAVGSSRKGAGSSIHFWNSSMVTSRTARPFSAVLALTRR